MNKSMEGKKCLPLKPSDPCPIPGTLMGEEENSFLKVVLGLPPPLSHKRTHTCAFNSKSLVLLFVSNTHASSFSVLQPTPISSNWYQQTEGSLPAKVPVSSQGKWMRGSSSAGSRSSSTHSEVGIQEAPISAFRGCRNDW